ncbi:hypothetical protein [Xanthobacter versatilis]|uniref:hypothetical protein n=1 Tax=Xanthobacter autotrophicus (strain ATCC BAA-1158 / Py2) TaxID=78245 RepID=UPI00372C8E6E
MPSEPAPAKRSPFDVSDTEIDEALAVCDGDPRETICALLVGQAFLEHEMSKLKADASAGFRRRRKRVED